jgi:hypothetical protein
VAIVRATGHAPIADHTACRAPAPGSRGRVIPPHLWLVDAEGRLRADCPAVASSPQPISSTTCALQDER